MRYTRRVLLVPLVLAAVSGCTSSLRVEGPRTLVDGKPVETSAFAIVNGEQVPPPDIQMGDPRTIERILHVGMNDNHVMDHLTHLTQEIGPRLTGSSNVQAANEWTRAQFETWGLSNSHLWEWGVIATRFDRGPSSVKVFAPGGETAQRELQFSTQAWTSGTQGPVRGRIVRMPRTIEEFDSIKDEVAGSWVLIPSDRSGRQGVQNRGGGAGTRFSRRIEARERLAKGEWPDIAPKAIEPPRPGDLISGTWEGESGTGDRARPLGMQLTLAEDGTVTGTMDSFGGPTEIKEGKFDGTMLTFKVTFRRTDREYSLKLSGESLEGETTFGDQPVSMALKRLPAGTVPEPDPGEVQEYILQKVLEQGPAGFASSSNDERVWTSGASGWKDRTVDKYSADVEVVISDPDYDYVNSRLADGATLELEVDLQHTLTAGPIACFNTIAEIPGVDPALKDEIIIVSAHLDSWNGPGSQGCVDNGTGSSVVLESARILMAAGAKPKRTIRFILWTGEEQGLLGSEAYVEHFTEEMSRVSAVFVDDGGTNYEGGLHAIEPMKDYLAAATAPINGRFYDEVDGEFLNVNVRVEDAMPRGGGSDHASFNAVGVPGFFWDEEGRANYQYGWHTQFDRLDQAIPNYLRQSATCMALTAYNLACAPEMLARQAKPEAQASAQ